MSFDVLAPHYGWMERVLAGEKLQRCRTAFLSETRDARHVLVAGEGHGRFISALLEANPTARVTCVDASARMLDQARARLRRNGQRPERVEFIQEDLLSWSPRGANFDLLVTQFFLDCFAPEQLEKVLARLSGAAAPTAHWLVSDFHEPKNGLARWRARSILMAMYLFFRPVTGLSARWVTPPDPFLRRHGFVLQERRLSEWGLLHADWWSRLASPIITSA